MSLYTEIVDFETSAFPSAETCPQLFWVWQLMWTCVLCPQENTSSMGWGRDKDNELECVPRELQGLQGEGHNVFTGRGVGWGEGVVRQASEPKTDAHSLSAAVLIPRCGRCLQCHGAHLFSSIKRWGRIVLHISDFQHLLPTSGGFYIFHRNSSEGK